MPHDPAPDGTGPGGAGPGGTAPGGTASDGTAPARPGEPEFDERIRVPLWWWPLGIGVAGLLAAEVHMGYPGVRAWLPYLLTVPLAVAILLRMGTRRVQVRDDELHVGQAHIPLRYLGKVEVIPYAAKRRALGPDLDPVAFVAHCPWVRQVVRVQLTDPQDPTPYWIFSARRADELAGILRHADAGPHDDEPGHRGDSGPVSS